MEEPCRLMRKKDLMDFETKHTDKAAIASKEINTIQKKWYFSMR